MGKFTAALIILFSFIKLAPMCARLPDDLSTLSSPAPVAAPVVSSVTVVAAPAPAPVPAPKAAPAGRPSLTVGTYRSRKMFPVDQGKYLVSVLRENKADAAAVGVRMTMTSRVNGADAERAESGPGQSLAAGTTSYFGLTVSTLIFDALLDAKEEEAGNELVWSVTYRFEGEPADKKRCFVHRALPRRREPEGITWKNLGDSAKCP